MTRAERLRDRMSALLSEAQARRGQMTTVDAYAFRRRVAELQRRATAERERLQALRDLLDCDIDALDDLDTDAIDLEIEVDEAVSAAA